MDDHRKTVQELKNIAAHFVKERDWDQFHSPKNLSACISIEAAELMEKFLWMNDETSYEQIEKNRADIEDEVADILMGLLMFCNTAKIDVSHAFATKLAKTALRYPVDKVKGRNVKYTEL